MTDAEFEELSRNAVRNTLVAFCDNFPRERDGEVVLHIAVQMVASLVATIAAWAEVDRCAVCRRLQREVCWLIEHFDDPEVNLAAERGGWLN